jgi:hypothetical protein
MRASGDWNLRRRGESMFLGSSQGRRDVPVSGPRTTKAYAGRTQTVPRAKSTAMHRGAYNSRINLRINLNTPGMLAPLPSRFAGSVLFLLAMLLAVPAYPQSWAGAEQQLAERIVSATGPSTMALEVLNRSSLSAAMTDDIRRNLLTQLAVLGVRFVPAEQAASTTRVSLSEDLQSYVWIAEVRPGATAPSIVMVSLPRSAPLSVEPDAAAMVLRRIPLWSQPERILDVAVIDGNPARILVLDANGVTSYRLQDSRWQAETSLAIVHSRPWPRDLRGRLVLGRDPGKDKDHLFDAYLPGVHCRSSTGAPPVMMCYDSDDPWPLGTDLSILNASFSSTRDFFGGALWPGVGKQTTAPAFYSAAAVPRDQTTSWLLAAVDGQVHLIDGSTDQVLERLNWGSDIAGVRSGCGSGWQVLATAAGEGRSDVVRAFEVVGRQPGAASAPLDVSGAITAMWTESSGTGVVAVAHNSETGKYEAFRLTLTCGR